MAKYCHRCHSENPDDAFWCVHCKTKILTTAVSHEENHPAMDILERELDRAGPVSEKRRSRPFIKTSILLCIVAVFCIVVYILFNNGYLASGFHEKFDINCQINEEFWFEGKYLNTSDGWSFELTKVKDYTLEGRILALKTYSKNDFPYNPCDIFSPIDLVIGIDDIQTNPEKYEYSITSFDHRVVSWYLYNEDINDYYYFRSHTGNNHIIPHTKEVIDVLAQNISIGDTVILKGSLIDLYGTKGEQYWRWTTDTAIGNYDCEIILVDEIEISLDV